jgi:hypothetical protein
MIPPKLRDVWIPKILISIGKESHHAILDLRSSVWSTFEGIRLLFISRSSLMTLSHLERKRYEA